MAGLRHNNMRLDFNAHTLETMEQMKLRRHEQSDFYFAIQEHHKKTTRSILRLVGETMNTPHRGSVQAEMEVYKTNFDYEVRRFAVGIHAYENMVRAFLTVSDEFFRQVPMHQLDPGVLMVCDHEVAAQNRLRQMLLHNFHKEEELVWPFPIL